MIFVLFGAASSIVSLFWLLRDVLLLTSYSICIQKYRIINYAQMRFYGIKNASEREGGSFEGYNSVALIRCLGIRIELHFSPNLLLSCIFSNSNFYEELSTGKKNWKLLIVRLFGAVTLCTITFEYKFVAQASPAARTRIPNDMKMQMKTFDYMMNLFNIASTHTQTRRRTVESY